MNLVRRTRVLREAEVGAASYSGNPLGLSSFDAAVLAILGIVLYDAANKQGPWATKR